MPVALPSVRLSSRLMVVGVDEGLATATPVCFQAVDTSFEFSTYKSNPDEPRIAVMEVCERLIGIGGGVDGVTFKTAVTRLSPIAAVTDALNGVETELIAIVKPAVLVPAAT